MAPLRPGLLGGRLPMYPYYISLAHIAGGLSVRGDPCEWERLTTTAACRRQPYRLIRSCCRAARRCWGVRERQRVLALSTYREAELSKLARFSIHSARTLQTT